MLGFRLHYHKIISLVFCFVLPRLLHSIQRSGDVPGSLGEPLGLGGKEVVFSDGTGSNPEPLASEEDALSTPPTLCG